MDFLKNFPKRIFFLFMSVVTLLCNKMDIPIKPLGPELDLAGYTQVWADEFNGDRLDETKWRGHNAALGAAPLRAYEGGYYSDRCLQVKDGNLILSIRRFDGSEPGYPAGWYFASVDSMPGFFDTYGYFECRCRLAKAVSGNSAFWLNCPSAYDTSIPKEEGVEIDVMESMRYGLRYEGCVEQNVHYFDGTGHQRLHARFFKTGGNPYEEFNTYGLKWDENGYTFYINRKEAFHTDFGVSHGPEYIVLSNFMRDFATKEIDGDSADFVVDYVRVYQKQA